VLLPALSRISYSYDQNLVVCNDSLEGAQLQNDNNLFSNPFKWPDLINYPDDDTLDLEQENLNLGSLQHFNDAGPNDNNSFDDSPFHGADFVGNLERYSTSISTELPTSAADNYTPESSIQTASVAYPVNLFPHSKKRKRSDQSQSLYSSPISRPKDVVPSQYLCEWYGCGQTFEELSEFGAHSKTHTHDGKFCLWSGCTELQGFKQRSKFNKHVNLHTKPIKCSECERRFSESSHLEKHIGIHRPASGYSVYWCPLGSDCIWGFGKGGSKDPSTRLATAKQHIKRRHKECSEPPIKEHIGSKMENEKLS